MKSGVGYEYEFKNIYTIISQLELNSGELIVYIPAVIFLFFCVYITIYKFGPLFFSYTEYRAENKIKIKKKQFIERIKLQNEIEDEVEKELK